MAWLHIFGLFALAFVIGCMWFCWEAWTAPLVDEHEQRIADEDMPRTVIVERERFSQ